MKNLEEMKALKAEEMAQVAGGWTYWMPQESDGVGGNRLQFTKESRRRETNMNRTNRKQNRRR